MAVIRDRTSLEPFDYVCRDVRELRRGGCGRSDSGPGAALGDLIDFRESVDVKLARELLRCWFPV